MQKACYQFLAGILSYWCCITTYTVKYEKGDSSSQYYSSIDIIHSEPSRHTPHVFDKDISELSPQFVKIYNQALAAESYSLDEIAGLGYRKSLDF